MTSDTPFTDAYPHIARWVRTCGWIEIGEDDYRHSLVRVLNIGGMVWEGGDVAMPLDAVLQTVDTALRDILHEIGR